MPIDPSIALGGMKQAQPIDFMQTLGQVAALKNQQQRALVDQEELTLRREQTQSQIEQRAQAVLKAQQEAADLKEKKEENERLTAHITGGGALDLETLSGVVKDPKRAVDLSQGIQTYQQAKQKNVTDKRTAAMQLLGGIEALPPELRPQAWTGLRQTAVDDLQFDAAKIPETYSPGWTKMMMRGLLTPEQQLEAGQPKLQNVPPGYSVIDERNPALGAVYTAPVAPAKAGTPEAFITSTYGPKPTPEQQLAGMRQWVAANKPPADPQKLEPGSQGDYIRRTFGAQPTDAQVIQGVREYHEAQRGQVTFNPGNLAGDPAVAGAYQDALSRATSGGNVTEAKRNSWNTIANRLAEKGDTKQLGEVIGQAAIESENVDQRNLIRGRVGMRVSLGEIRKDIEEMRAAGMDPSLLRGSAENIAQQAGLTGNPKLARLSARMKSNLVNYRRATTGVQFGEKEAEAYESNFPSSIKGGKLNIAIIDGLLDQVKSDDAVYWYGKVGPDGMRLIAPSIRPDKIGWPDIETAPKTSVGIKSITEIKAP